MSNDKITKGLVILMCLLVFIGIPASAYFGRNKELQKPLSEFDLVACIDEAIKHTSGFRLDRISERCIARNTLKRMKYGEQ